MKLIDVDLDSLKCLTNAQYLVKTTQGNFVCNLSIHKNELRFLAAKASNETDWVWPVDDKGFIEVKEIIDGSEN